MTIPGINTDVGGGLTPIAANSLLGNDTNSTAVPAAIPFGDVPALIGVPTNAELTAALVTKVDTTDSRLSDAREWIAATISQAEAEAGVATDRRAFTAERVRQAIRVTPDFNPTGNLFTIGTTTNAQRLRLRRRFAGAGDFSQLSIDFSGDNCRIQTQQAGNAPNPLVLGTNGTDRVFVHGLNNWVGIGGAPTTRPLEIFASTAGFRLQVNSAVSPPVYSEIARTFDLLTWQDSTSPFNTFTDLVANSNQFNAHSIRFFVHNNGTSAPILCSTMHSTGRVSIGNTTDDGTSRLLVTGQLRTDGALQAFSLETRNGTTPTSVTIQNTWTSSTNRETGFVRWVSNILQIGTEKGSGGGLARALEFQTDGVTRVIIGAAGGFTWSPFTSTATLATNQQATIEFTSNTAGNIVYRGSDGVTRRFAFTLS